MIFFYLSLFVLLPSGLLIELKILLYFFVFLSYLHSLTKYGVVKSDLLIILLLFSYILIWFLHGVQNQAVALNDLIGYTVNVLMVPLLFIIFTRISEHVNCKKLLLSFIFSVFLYILLKLMLIVFIATEIVSIELIDDMGVSYQIFYGDLFSSRVTFANDYLIPLAALIAVNMIVRGDQYISHKILYFILAFFTLAAALTYVRAIWALQLFAIFYLLYKKNLTLLVSAAIILISGVILATFVETDYVDSIVKAFVLKFSDFESIDVKTQQASILLSESDESVWFGHGSASYTPQIIRDISRPYLYEVQIIALIYQMGIVGVTFYFMIIFNKFVTATRMRSDSLHIYVYLFLQFVVFFTNPVLLSYSGFLFFFIPYVALIYRAK